MSSKSDNAVRSPDICEFVNWSSWDNSDSDEEKYMRLSFVFLIFIPVRSCFLMESDVLMCVSSDNDRSAILELTPFTYTDVIDICKRYFFLYVCKILLDGLISRVSARRIIMYFYSFVHGDDYDDSVND